VFLFEQTALAMLSAEQHTISSVAVKREKLNFKAREDPNNPNCSLPDSSS